MNQKQNFIKNMNMLAEDVTKEKPENQKGAQRIQDYIDENLSYDEEIILADGFEDAFIGVGRKFGSPPFAIYNRELCLKLLEEQGMTREESEEYFEFNVAGAYVGENTPAFIDLCE